MNRGDFVNWFKQVSCRHLEVELIRWHWTHLNSGDSRCIKAEYRCVHCNKKIYDYYFGSEAVRFSKKYYEKEF